MKIYDLKSDTVTVPSAGMRKAIHEAEVGDDVYSEDPTINRLQDYSAGITGKEAALFVPSGSMGNLIPIYLNCGSGNEIITHKNSHILHYELASLTAVAGVMPVGVDGKRGILTLDAVSPRIRPDIYYMARTRMIEIENTHNIEGGTYYSLKELEDLFNFARKKNLSVHMDGARVFNAATALEGNTESIVKEISSYTDTITFCLSKGLGAPVGAMLCGDSHFIKEARRLRKMLGGGMRQAGLLAAAGLYALKNNLRGLSVDHKNARKIAAALASTNWADLNPESIETNIIYFRTVKESSETLVSKLKTRGILCGAAGERKIRMLTHLGITEDDTKNICSIIESM